MTAPVSEVLESKPICLMGSPCLPCGAGLGINCPPWDDQSERLHLIPYPLTSALPPLPVCLSPSSTSPPPPAPCSSTARQPPGSTYSTCYPHYSRSRATLSSALTQLPLLSQTYCTFMGSHLDPASSDFKSSALKFPFQGPFPKEIVEVAKNG